MQRPSMHHHTARFRGPKDRVGLNTALNSAVDDLLRLKIAKDALMLRQQALLEYNLSGEGSGIVLETFANSNGDVASPVGIQQMVYDIVDLEYARRNDLI